jgi:hypothetical protein
LVFAAGQPRVRDTKRFQLDLDSCRADIERDHIQTEEWDLHRGGSFVALGPSTKMPTPSATAGCAAMLQAAGYNAYAATAARSSRGSAAWSERTPLPLWIREAAAIPSMHPRFAASETRV